MSRLVRNWREAATVMLCTPRSANVSISNNDKTISNVQKTRGTAPTKSKTESLVSTSFDILMLKRSNRSQFLPSVYVFPGGISHDSDFSEKWIELFRSCGEQLNFDKFTLPNKNLVNNNGHESVFSKKRDVVSSIPGEVGIRICAIRETFEESGVLIAKYVDDVVTLLKNKTSLFRGRLLGSTLTSPALSEWRGRVIRDARQFVVMCRELEIVPDVWALSEWSNWLTPVISPAHLAAHTRRFDTAFFMCCVPSSARALEDQGETVHSLWTSPRLIVQSWSQTDVGLAGPQLYELARLLNFDDVDSLLKSVCEIATHRPERWMGVFCACADVLLELLPGDSLYPEKVNYNKKAVIFREETHDELRTRFPNTNRVVYSATPKRGRLLGIECNIQLHSHVTPVNLIRHQSVLSVQ